MPTGRRVTVPTLHATRGQGRPAGYAIQVGLFYLPTSPTPPRETNRVAAADVRRQGSATGMRRQGPGGTARARTHGCGGAEDAVRG